MTLARQVLVASKVIQVLQVEWDRQAQAEHKETQGLLEQEVNKVLLDQRVRQGIQERQVSQVLRATQALQAQGDCRVTQELRALKGLVVPLDLEVFRVQLDQKARREILEQQVQEVSKGTLEPLELMVSKVILAQQAQTVSKVIRVPQDLRVTLVRLVKADWMVPLEIQELLGLMD